MGGEERAAAALGATGTEPAVTPKKGTKGKRTSRDTQHAPSARSPHAVPKIPQVCPHVLDAAVDVAPLLHAHARQLHHERLQQAGPAQSRGWASPQRCAGCRLNRCQQCADCRIPGNCALTMPGLTCLCTLHLLAWPRWLAPVGTLRKVLLATQTTCKLVSMPHADSLLAKLVLCYNAGRRQATCRS